jgi:hypothetical protein
MTRNGYLPGRLRPGFFYAVLRCEERCSAGVDAFFVGMLETNA